MSEAGSDKPESWRNVHPDFDGHLEKPLLKMTVEERLEWIRQGMLLLHWRDARVRKSPPDETRGQQ